MSHVCEIELLVDDLESLAEACNENGLKLNLGQTKYNWWGHHVGDWPLPVGFKKADLGKCEHAISVVGNPDAYEIGLARYPVGTKKKVKLADGSEQEIDVGGKFAMLFDFYQGGKGLMAKCGDNAEKLLQSYAVQVATKQARRQGFRVQKKVQADGRVQLVCSK